MLSIKYKPSNLEEIIENKNAINIFTEWLLNWKSTNIAKCALVFGSTGIGKSLITDLLLNKYNYNILNTGNDNERTIEYFNNIKPLLNANNNLKGGKNILVFDNVDVSSDYGFITNLTTCITASKIPIICICENKYAQSLKPILKYCCDIKIQQQNNKDILDYVKYIVAKEKIKVNIDELKNLIESSNGDIRFILNNLQLGMFSGNKDNYNDNIFETTKDILSICNTFENKYNTYWLANDIHPLMIHENYISNILMTKQLQVGLDRISYSADAISDYDLVNNVIHTNANWELEPYVACNTIRATLNCHNNNIQFTTLLGKISSINANKKLNIDYSTETLGKKKIEKVVKEKVVKEKVVKEKVVKEKVVKEKVVKEKVVKEKVVKEKVVKEKVVKEKVVKEKVVKNLQ
jgi:replication factor C subunit 1